MMEKEKTDYDVATVCTVGGEPFTDANWKVRHHCLVSGNYLYPACNNCNLQLKTTSRKRKANGNDKRQKKKKKKSNDDDEVDYDSAEEEYIDNFFLPIVFHNLKCYDAHFVIKHFKKYNTPSDRTTTTNHPHMMT